MPQSRRRVIFWAAKRGLALPSFPVPVYAYPKGCHTVSLPTGKKLMPASRSQNPSHLHQYAPLKPITIDMAISDLVCLQFILDNFHDFNIPYLYRKSLTGTILASICFLQFLTNLSQGESSQIPSIFASG